jgi:hypothetical protein
LRRSAVPGIRARACKINSQDLAAIPQPRANTHTLPSPPRGRRAPGYGRRAHARTSDRSFDTLHPTTDKEHHPTRYSRDRSFLSRE